MAVSIVIPVYNEESSVDPLLERIAKVIPLLPTPSEVLVVNDGSEDQTMAKLLVARQRYPWLKIVELRRNFGQHAATYAGFDTAQGDMVVTLDGDLQNDPADIPKLLEKMKEGYDVVCGWRTQRKDPFISRKLPSMIVNRLIRSEAPTPIHDYGCFLRAYTQQAAKELSVYSTPRGWFPVLFSKLGYRVGEVPVTHRARPGGESSHHDLFTRIDQFMSVFMGVKAKPFQFVEVVGVAAILLGGLGLIVGCVSWLAGTHGPCLWWILFSIAASLWGFLTAVTGLVGEYLVRTNYELGRHPKYLVRRVHG
jgi:glycosyltransferase involved in cell wall biosynthesis